MKFKIKDGMLYNETGDIVAVMTDAVSEQEEKAIEATGEALEAIENFIGGINSGTHKPKKAADAFQRILDKYELN